MTYFEAVIFGTGAGPGGVFAYKQLGTSGAFAAMVRHR